MKRLLSFVALLSLAIGPALCQISGFPSYLTSPVGLSGSPAVTIPAGVSLSAPVTVGSMPPVTVSGPVSLSGTPPVYTPVTLAERQRAESFPFSIANFDAVKGTGTLATSSWNVGYANQIQFNGQKYNSANASANQLMYVTTNGNRVISMGTITIAVSSTAAPTSTTVGSTTITTPAVFTLATTTVFGGTSYTIANNSTLTIPGYDVRAPDFFILYIATPAGGASDATAVQFIISVNNGWDMTDDDRPGLQGVQLEIGDSITNGTGTVNTPDTWLFLLNQYYQSRGYPLRRVNRGEYGKKSDYMSYRFQYGTYNFNVQNVKVITYMIGTNDAAVVATLTTAQLDVIQANMTVALQWRKTYCPGSVMFIIGAPSMSNSYQSTYGFPNAESNLALIRTRQRNMVTAWLAANPTDTRLRFIDFGGTAGDPAFPTPVLDKTTTTSYSDGLHPNKAGNALMGASITGYIDQTANKYVLVPY